MSKFRTVRFGELEFRDEDVIHLPDGLVGMPTLRKWLVLDMGDGIPMKWFQSLDRGDFGFPVTQPDLFLDDYDLAVPTGAQQKLGCGPESEVAAMIITTVHAGGERVTGNLLAPLVIDTGSRRGVQLALEDARYSMRQEINYFKFGLAVQSDSAENDSVAQPQMGEANRAPGGDAPVAAQNDSREPVEV